MNFDGVKSCNPNFYTKLGFGFYPKFGFLKAKMLKVLKPKVRVEGGPKSVKTCVRTQKDFCKTFYGSTMIISYFGEKYVTLMVTFFLDQNLN